MRNRINWSIYIWWGRAEEEHLQCTQWFHFLRDILPTDLIQFGFAPCCLVLSSQSFLFRSGILITTLIIASLVISIEIRVRYHGFTKWSNIYASSCINPWNLCTNWHSYSSSVFFLLPSPAPYSPYSQSNMLAARSKLVFRSLSARTAMQVSDTMVDGLIEQANQELNASNLYLSMSLWFHDQELPGSAIWCRTHSDEERDHALRIFDHIVKRRAKGALIRNVDPKQSFDFETPADAW